MHVSGMFWLAKSSAVAGSILLQVFIGALLFWRFSRKAPIIVIPDEILVLLPYLWAISIAANTAGFSSWHYHLLLIVFSCSLFQVVDGKHGFSGGIWKNSLLFAICCSICFVLLMAVFLLHILPPFSIELFIGVLGSLFVFCAGIPVSLSAFYSLLPQRS